MHQALVEYIEQNLGRFSAEDLVAECTKHGYAASDVLEVIAYVKENRQEALSSLQKQQRSQPPLPTRMRSPEQQKGQTTQVRRFTPRYRSPGIALLLSFITLGLYQIYWFVSVGKELRSAYPKGPHHRLLLVAFASFLAVAALGYADRVLVLPYTLAFALPLVALLFGVLLCASSFLFLWRFCAAASTFTGINAVLLFLLWFLVSPVALFLIQYKINEHAERT